MTHVSGENSRSLRPRRVARVSIWVWVVATAGAGCASSTEDSPGTTGQSCNINADCEGQCLPLGGIPVCASHCKSDGECPTDWVCTTFGGLDSKVCRCDRPGGPCAIDAGVCPDEGGPSCGDGRCAATESCECCPDDCGECKPECGDGVCVAGERCNVCIQDCGRCPDAGPDGSLPAERVSFEYEEFSDACDLSLNGTAACQSGVLRLTPAEKGSKASAYYPSMIPLGENTSFETSFRLRIHGGTRPSADGIVFFLHAADEGTGALGGSGGRLGYEGIRPSVAVEYDTWADADVSSTTEEAHHLAIHLDGTPDANAGSTMSPVDLATGEPVYTWIHYSGAREQLSIYISDSAQRPVNPVLNAFVDLESRLIYKRLFVGFTAATGGAYANHDIESWSFRITRP